MIPSPPGLNALFRVTSLAGEKIIPDGSPPACHFERVVAWNGEGEPLIADPNTGRLVSATERENFAGLGADTSLVQIIPGGGWQVAWTDDTTADECSCPLVAWGLLADGTVIPLGTNGSDFVDQLQLPPGSRLSHPSERRRTTTAGPALEAV